MCFKDEPGAPGVPVPTDWDRDHVDLQWTPPLNDGGSPVTAYIIEKREKGTNKWLKGAEVPASADCKATVPHLEENTEYEFRVRAVNAAGPGEASGTSKSVITKPRKCNTHILKILKHVFYYKMCFFCSFSGTEDRS